jgi:hypothetical protein
MSGIFESNKEISLRDEANAWEGSASPSQSAPEKATSLVAGRSFRPEGRGLKPVMNIDDRYRVVRGYVAKTVGPDR